jgi:hypothetical protein
MLTGNMVLLVTAYVEKQYSTANCLEIVDKKGNSIAFRYFFREGFLVRYIYRFE